MGKWKSIRYVCDTCEQVMDEVVDLNTEDEDQTWQCDAPCGGTFNKTLSMNSHGFNTAKMSQSIPSGVRKFEDIRAKRSLEYSIKKAKRERNADDLVAASKESAERGVGAKGSIEKGLGSLID